MDIEEKRRSPRHYHEATVRISLFNRKGEWDGQLLNHCQEGVCFRSRIPLPCRSAVVIRVTGGAWTNLRPEACSSLRSMTIGEVKWCAPRDEESGCFVTGVKALPTGA
jgi:hypothetical protein